MLYFILCKALVDPLFTRSFLNQKTTNLKEYSVLNSMIQTCGTLNLIIKELNWLVFII